MDRKICVISSFAKDEILYKKRNNTIIERGGPAFWITNTLKDLCVRYDIVCGATDARVRIIVDNGNETGSIVFVDKIFLDCSKTANVFIISTINDEFALENINQLRGIIALDVQGYIRSLCNKHSFNITKDLLQHIDIIKATNKESHYINKELIKNQKNRILIITKGIHGVDIFSNNKKYYFPAIKLKIKNTIGAGDVFFTTFVVKFIQTGNVQASGNYAIRYTERFLLNK